MKKQQKSITKILPKLRPLGQVLLDIEPLLLEMCVDHDLQWADILSLVHVYLQVHAPNAQEQYTAGGSPIFYYGPLENKPKE